jgi:hypothetical protein
MIAVSSVSNRQQKSFLSSQTPWWRNAMKVVVNTVCPADILHFSPEKIIQLG